MAIIKCKMCGGELSFLEGGALGVCDFCGTTQTIPSADNEKKLSLFARANRIRMACEFDKAAAIYESIAAEFPEEPEAYWGLVLCKYGIEYVDDPSTGKKIPTCHRSSFENVMDDANYELAVKKAGVLSAGVYRSEAETIEELRKGIIEVSNKEAPYDIFICYKETAEDGNRTIDSVIAQDVYDALSDKGYRVFFSRITLEDKLGQEYEPYIFSALHSAKVMLAFGSSYDYYNAVWVKNEWSRFLQLIAKGEKKTLIPCYKNIDAYDMPPEFARLQAQDMGKVGAIQDLLRGVEKIIPRQAPAASPQPAYSPSTSQGIILDAGYINDVIRKVLIQLENKKWKSVQDMCDKLIDADPECAMAYVCQLARVRRVTKIEDLGTCVNVLSNSDYYKNALKYADEELKQKLQEWCRQSEESCRAAEERCVPLAERANKLEGIIASGKHHTAALMTNGTVKTCGKNEKGQRNVGAWRNIVYICCGDDTTVGLRSDGTVVACGDNEHGQCNVKDWTDIVAVSCNAYHTVGVKSDGTVVACGSNENGRCDISGWTNIEKVYCGYRHTVGRTKDGKYVAVGKRDSGQCKVDGWWDDDLISCSANNLQTAGITRHGTVVKCGSTDDNRLDTKAWRDIVAISCGTHHTAGLKADGTVVTCGDDGQSRCSGTASWTGIVALGQAFWHTVGIRADGTVVACGDDTHNRIDVGSWKLFNSIDTLEEERAEALEQQRIKDEADDKIKNRIISRHRNVSKLLSAGQNHTVAVCTDGRILTCGSNEKGQCNVKGWKKRGVIAVACGSNHTVGLCADGTVVACGDNEFGQCNVTGWKDIVAISCNDYHTVGLKSDGTAVSCGSSENDRCNVGSWTDIVKISCGYRHTVGQRKDGTFVCAGSNSCNQSDISKVYDLADFCADNMHTVGLTHGGNIIVWGGGADDNEFTQKDADGFTDVLTISSGSHHMAGMTLSGEIIACGMDDFGRCSGTRSWDAKNIGAVICGQWSTLGVRTDGTVVAVGYNEGHNLNLSKWKLFENIDKIEEEIEYYKKQKEKKDHLRISLRDISDQFLVAEANAVLKADGSVVYVGNDPKLSPCSSWKNIVKITTCFGVKYHNREILSNKHVVGLMSNGLVLSCGDNHACQCNTNYWNNIVDIACGNGFTVGVCVDGRVISSGFNDFYQCNVNTWQNVVSVYGFTNQTVGIHRNGTIVSCGGEGCRMFIPSPWPGLDIKKIVRHENEYIVALCRNGALMGGQINSDCGPTDCLNLMNGVVMVASCEERLACLLSDGTVKVISGTLRQNMQNSGSCKDLGWKNIVSICAGDDYIIGLSSDGTLVSTGTSEYGKINVNKLEDVIAISAVGSSIMAICSNGCGFCYNEGKWSEYRGFNSLEEIEALLYMDRNVHIPTDPYAVQQVYDYMNSLNSSRIAAGVCRHCGGELKGLVGKKCVVCGTKKDY